MFKKIFITASFIILSLSSFSQNKDLAIAIIPELTLSHRSDQVSVTLQESKNEIVLNNESGLILKVTVFNILGDELLIETIDSGSTNIDVTNLPSGTYIVAFADDNRVTTQRLVIK